MGLAGSVSGTLQRTYKVSALCHKKDKPVEAGVTHINFSTHFARIGFYQSTTITRGGDWKKICSEKMPK